MKRAITSSLMSIIILLTFVTQANSKSVNTDDFQQYMSSTVKYPEKARLKNLQGNSIILFTLSKGKLNNIKIEAELGEGCEVEVLNALMAYQNLKIIKDGKYALITSFSLKGATTVFEHENAKAPEGYITLKVTITAESTVANTVAVTGYAKSDKTILVNETGHMNMIFRGHPLNPKVFIDSVQTEYSQLKYVIPERIQSVQVLKGTLAVANYGPDAVNGVIVITTKKDNQKLELKKDSTNKQK